jgi:hydroxymethylpyrimidine pyrophosphatase-like HAD family hydrolase
VNIALDYDDTYTADPGLWDDFISAAHGRGHRVFIVTARPPDMLIDEVPGIPPTRHVYTNLQSKLTYCADVLGLSVDIWIDDRPDKLVSGW